MMQSPARATMPEIPPMFAIDAEEFGVASHGGAVAMMHQTIVERFAADFPTPVAPQPMLLDAAMRHFSRYIGIFALLATYAVVGRLIW